MKFLLHLHLGLEWLWIEKGWSSIKSEIFENFVLSRTCMCVFMACWHVCLLLMMLIKFLDYAKNYFVEGHLLFFFFNILLWKMNVSFIF